MGTDSAPQDCDRAYLGMPFAESREEKAFASEAFRESKLGCGRLAEFPKDARFIPQGL